GYGWSPSAAEGRVRGGRAALGAELPAASGDQRPLSRSRVFGLQLPPHLEDERSHTLFIELRCGPQALGRHAGEVAGERGESPLLRVRGDARQLEKLERDPRFKLRLADFGAPLLRGVDPLLSELFKELIHEPLA